MREEYYKEALERFLAILRNKEELKPLQVEIRALSPGAAIGQPSGEDYPLLRGKEVLLQASFQGGIGQAFTTQPLSCRHTLADLLNVPANNAERAVFIAAINAVLNYLGVIKGTVHCRDSEPQRCGLQVAREIKAQHGMVNVGIVGYQPAIISSCVKEFGSGAVKVTDLDLHNIGPSRFGVEIWDGTEKTGELVESSQVLLVTGTTAVNGTIASLLELAAAKPLYFYGTTIAGLAHLMNYRRICPFSSH